MALKRILIVEDSIDVGRMYLDTIRTAYPCVPVTFVPSAEEGILEATRFAFDLIIADIRLPGISGFDLVRKVRVRQPAVKALMVTGLKIDGDLEKQAKSVGADLLLPKPIGDSEFIKAIEQISGEAAAPGAAEAETARGKRGRTSGLRKAVNESKTEPRLPDTAPAKSAAATAAHPLAASGEVEAGLPPAEAPTLGAALGDLRGSLGALAVILLSDQGRVVAQAGEWPEADLETRVVAEVMSALNALEKVSYQFRAGLPLAAHALRGQNFDLAFAPVGRFAVLVFLRAAPNALRLALAFDQLLAAQVQLAAILEGMGLVLRPLTGALAAPSAAPAETPAPEAPAAPLATPPAAVEELPEDPARLSALEALLGKVQAQAQVDADSFWDQATSGEAPSAPASASSGALSYEQAQKLGLVGEENS